MPRLIDANKIVYSWTIDNDGEEHDGVTLQSIIDKMPTVDAVPKAEYDHLLKRFKHLIQSDYIKSFDAWDSRKNGYALDIRDAEPVRHGYWINHHDDLYPEESTQECSVCHAEQMATMLDDNYCPHCGAIMDKVE